VLGCEATGRVGALAAFRLLGPFAAGREELVDEPVGVDVAGVLAGALAELACRR